MQEKQALMLARSFYLWSSKTLKRTYHCWSKTIVQNKAFPMIFISSLANFVLCENAEGVRGRIKMLRKLSPVPKSLQMHFRYHGIEDSEMLWGDLGPQDRHLVQVTGIIIIRHTPRNVGFKLWGHNGKMEGFLGKLLKTYSHSSL